MTLVHGSLNDKSLVGFPDKSNKFMKKNVTCMWYSNGMFHYMLKAECATLVKFKSPVGLSEKPNLYKHGWWILQAIAAEPLECTGEEQVVAGKNGENRNSKLDSMLNPEKQADGQLALTQVWKVFFSMCLEPGSVGTWYQWYHAWYLAHASCLSLCLEPGTSWYMVPMVPCMVPGTC